MYVIFPTIPVAFLRWAGGTDPPTPKGGWWPMTEAEAFPEKNGGKQRAERFGGRVFSLAN